MGDAYTSILTIRESPEGVYEYTSIRGMFCDIYAKLLDLYIYSSIENSNCIESIRIFMFLYKLN
jgi:hypothetical protein